MRFKTSVSLTVAIVLGLITAYVGVKMMQTYKRQTVPAAKIVMAKVDMEPGYVVQDADVSLEPVPAGMIPAKAMRNLKDAVGRTVLTTVVSGYPLADNALAARDAGGGLQAMVPKGLRAVTLDVSDSSSVANMLTPGCNVDVIATLHNGEQTLAKTIVQNVKVQYVQRTRTSTTIRGGTVTGLDNGPIKTVTLLVTPKQANTIELATSNGAKPRLLLRGTTADGEEKDSAISSNELLGIPDPVPATKPVEPEQPVAKTADDATFENVAPVPEPDKGFEIEIIRAGQASKSYVERPKEEGNGATTMPVTADQSKRAGTAAPRTASGKLPESSAPRKDARTVK